MRRIRTGGLRLPEPEAAEGHYGRNLSGASQCNDPFCGTETPGEDTAPTDSEEVDYSDFDLVRTMKMPTSNCFASTNAIIFAANGGNPSKPSNRSFLP